MCAILNEIGGERSSEARGTTSDITELECSMGLVKEEQLDVAPGELGYRGANLSLWLELVCEEHGNGPRER